MKAATPSVALQGAVWYLTHIDGIPQYYPDRWRYTPVRYTLDFFGDPTPDPNLGYNLRGDMQCNGFTADYATDTSQALTITLGLMTTAGCLPEDTVSGKYWARFFSIAHYRVDSTPDGLVLYLFDASGQEILRYADHYIWTKAFYLPFVKQVGQ